MAEMTVEALQELISDEASFKKAFRKIDSSRLLETDPKNEVIKLLVNQFRPGKVPFVHQVVFPNGSQLRLKFVDTVKRLYDSKGRELMGRESYLTYLEVVLAPAGSKACSFSLDVSQVVWGTSKAKATEKYNADKAKLLALATELGIDLSVPDAWCTLYSQNY